MPVLKIKKEDGTWEVVGNNIEVDPSLEIEGMAADAKAVGDAINDLSIDIAEAGSIDIDLEGANVGNPNPVNADTLDGRPASDYALKADFDSIELGVGKAGEAEGAEVFNSYEDTEFEEIYGDEIYTWTVPANKALGKYSHAEGAGTIASGDYSHAEGCGGMETIILTGDPGATAFIFDYEWPDELHVGLLIKFEETFSKIIEIDLENSSIVLDSPISNEALNNSTAYIYYGIASAGSSHAEGAGTIASGDSSHAEGAGTIASGDYSHAEGAGTIASGDYSHAEGARTIASGYFSHAEGLETIASGYFSHAEGAGTIASGYYSHAEGAGTIASGDSSHAEGAGTIASGYFSHAEGMYNIEDTDGLYLHIVGNGGYENKSNAHTIDWSGNAVFAGTVSAPGADYAEHFEWLDGNPNNEDRVGTIVTLEGNKIRPAMADDEILGVISGTAMVIGDNAEWEWQGKFLTDDYGRVITEMVEEFIDIKDPKTGEVKEKKTVGFIKRRKLNPEWNANQEYTRRADRPEWDVVGLFGKLHVTDDGTCVPNGWATVGEDGKATASATKTNMRVMKRITDNIVLVFMK